MDYTKDRNIDENIKQRELRSLERTLESGSLSDLARNAGTCAADAKEHLPDFGYKQWEDGETQKTLQVVKPLNTIPEYAAGSPALLRKAWKILSSIVTNANDVSGLGRIQL